MLNTHINFKTIDTAFKDAQTIENYIGEAIESQHMFEKMTTPWEIDFWEGEELKNFKIDLEKIDRLYYISYFEAGGLEDFKLLCRMEYNNNKSVYVELSASCDYTGFEDTGEGKIFLSFDANLFMKIIDTRKYPMEHILQSLLEDGIELDDDVDNYDKISKTFKHNVPMLKYLCHDAVYNNKELLSHYPEILPPILKTSLDEFIQLQEVKADYEDFM